MRLFLLPFAIEASCEVSRLSMDLQLARGELAGSSNSRLPTWVMFFKRSLWSLFTPDILMMILGFQAQQKAFTQAKLLQEAPVSPTPQESFFLSPASFYAFKANTVAGPPMPGVPTQRLGIQKRHNTQLLFCVVSFGGEQFMRQGTANLNWENRSPPPMLRKKE